MNLDRIAPAAIGIVLVLLLILGLGHAANSLDSNLDSRLSTTQGK
jgi:hypothetical protein